MPTPTRFTCGPRLEHKPDTLLQDYKVAVQLYSEAIALDPDFALAHARLACTSAAIFHFQEPLDEWAKKARVEADTALRLDRTWPKDTSPSASMSLIGLTTVMRPPWRNSPSPPAFRLTTAMLPADRGDQTAAGANARPSWRTSGPRNSIRRTRTLHAISSLPTRPCGSGPRRGARPSVGARWRPDSLVAKIQSGYLDFQVDGPHRLAQVLLAQMPAGTDPDGIVTATRWDVAMIERDFVGGADVLRNRRVRAVGYFLGGNTPETFLPAAPTWRGANRRRPNLSLKRRAANFAEAVRRIATDR